MSTPRRGSSLGADGRGGETVEKSEKLVAEPEPMTYLDLLFDF